jgi:hypothetical protein
MTPRAASRGSIIRPDPARGTAFGVVDYSARRAAS